MRDTTNYHCEPAQGSRDRFDGWGYFLGNFGVREWRCQESGEDKDARRMSFGGGKNVYKGTIKRTRFHRKTPPEEPAPIQKGTKKGKRGRKKEHKIRGIRKGVNVFRWVVAVNVCKVLRSGSFAGNGHGVKFQTGKSRGQGGGTAKGLI